MPPGAEIPSTEMFGLPQLGDAVQAMLPDVQRTLRKVNDNLDGLQVTLARANDLLNDRNRADHRAFPGQRGPVALRNAAQGERSLSTM